jgi:hypothetical protein
MAKASQSNSILGVGSTSNVDANESRHFKDRGIRPAPIRNHGLDSWNGEYALVTFVLKQSLLSNLERPGRSKVLVCRFPDFFFYSCRAAVC